MSGVGASVEFDDKEMREYLKAVMRKVKNVKDGEKKYVGLLSAIVYRDIMDHFEQEEGPDGRWTAWSDIYQKHMMRIGRGSNKILQFSGKLRNQFTPNKNRVTRDGILWYNDAVTKNGFEYAHAHNFGEGKIPARTFMWLSQKAMEDVSEQTLQFMIEEKI